MIAEHLDNRPLGEHDICVIGSGPAGLVVALEAARHGKRVLVLESGGLGPEPRQQALSDAQILDPRRHDNMAIAVARQFGGTSNLWGARCQPLDRIDFEDRPWIDARWPITYADILPYYAQAVDYLAAGADVFSAPIAGVASTSDEFEVVRLERFSNTPAVQIHMAKDLERSDLIDIRLHSTIVDLKLEHNRITAMTVVDPDGGRRVIAMSSPVVLACGGLESTRQLLVLQQKHPFLFGGGEGPLGQCYMGHIIGEVADIIFRDDPVEIAFDFFDDGNGSYARRRFVPSDAVLRSNELLNVCFWPVVPPVADARHRSGILSMVCLALAIPPLGRLLVAEAIRKRHIPDTLAWTAHLINVFGDLPRTLAYVPQFFYKRYLAKLRLPGLFIRNPARRYGLSYHSEQSPQSESRVFLSDDSDRFGVPKLVIDYRFARSDAERIYLGHKLLGDWLDRSGIGKMEFRQKDSETVDEILTLAAHGTHQIGTARMGANAREGVVDANLRCFGIDNLYVASSAVFPTSGQCNPTLSIAAFAVRLAEHLCNAHARC